MQKLIQLLEVSLAWPKTPLVEKWLRKNRIKKDDLLDLLEAVAGKKLRDREHGFKETFKLAKKMWPATRFGEWDAWENREFSSEIETLLKVFGV